MTIEQTTNTTSTPGVITTIKKVTGTVWHVNPPESVILTLEDGKKQEFRIPNGTKFTVIGQPSDAFSLEPGMKFTATAVTEVPEVIDTKQVTNIGEMPPPTETVDPDIAVLVVKVPYVPEANTATTDLASTPAPAESTPALLPKTGSSMPLIGLLGALFFVLAFGLKATRALITRSLRQTSF